MLQYLTPSSFNKMNDYDKWMAYVSLARHLENIREFLDNLDNGILPLNETIKGIEGELNNAQ